MDINWTLNYQKIVDELRSFVRELHQFIRCHHYDEPTGTLCQSHLRLLDRLVTCCQLIRMSINCSLEEFSRSSNIETIVDNEIERTLELRVIEQSMRILNVS